jgi:hypothetical protein
MSSPEAAAVEMQRIASAIRALTHVPSRASRGAATTIGRLIDRQFETGTDPYGRRWKALKPSTIKRKGHAQIGVDSHRMRDSIDVRPMSGAGVQITVGPDYAAYFAKRRPLFPTHGLPRAWRNAVTDALTQEAKATLSGTGATGAILDAAAE